jgi:hypothetical protein
MLPRARGNGPLAWQGTAAFASARRSDATVAGRTDPEALLARFWNRARSGANRTSSRTRSPSNVTGCVDCGGQSGYYFYHINQPHSGAYGLHTAYTAGELLGPTSFVSDLFAPTSREGGSCLEIGTHYRNSGPTFGVTLAEVYAYDFCDPAAIDKIGVFHQLQPLDENFRTRYTRDFGDGFPQYTFQTWQNYDGTWSVALYDYKTPKWAPQYTSQTATLNPKAQGANGWDLFETHFAISVQCTYLQPIKSSGERWYNTQTNTWEFLGTFDSTAYIGTPPPAECLNTDDGQGVGDYYIVTPTCNDTCVDGYHEWVAASFPSSPYLPPPPPGGGGGGGECFDPSLCCDLYPTAYRCCPWYDPSLCCGYGAGFDHTQCYIISAARRAPMTRMRGTEPLIAATGERAVAARDTRSTDVSTVLMPPRRQ